MNRQRLSELASALIVLVVLIAFFSLFCRYAVRHVEAREKTPSERTERSLAERDGAHDFDFEIGTWKTHLTRLQHPLTGSKTWVEYDGTSVIRKVWDGRANLVELRVDGPAGHIEGASMRLYNPTAHQWSLNFANVADGALGKPTVGDFKNGRGEFYDQEDFKGRMIFVRQVFSEITPTSYRFEQSFSDDGGKTWEPNWIAIDTLVKKDVVLDDADANGTSTDASDAEWNRDFDFNLGTFKTHISRLQHPLTGSTTWTDYDGVSVVRKVLDGRASLFELEATGPAGHLEGVGLRLYNPKSHQWSMNWANSKDGVMTTPVVGRFNHGQGQFYDQEAFLGKIIMVRNGFPFIAPDSSRFEQAFSDDAGKTWEINWIMTFTRRR
jgi:hypothetical protein